MLDLKLTYGVLELSYIASFAATYLSKTKTPNLSIKKSSQPIINLPVIFHKESKT